MSVSVKKRTAARFLGRMIPGSVPAADMPRVIPNVAPLLVEEPPIGDTWIHEIKFDGYRMQVLVDEGSVKITSRTTLDWTHRFPYIAAAFKALPVRRLVMDGEIISANEMGAAGSAPANRQRRRSM